MFPNPVAVVDTSSAAGMPSRMPMSSAVSSIIIPESIFSLMIPNSKKTKLRKKTIITHVVFIL